MNPLAIFLFVTLYNGNCQVVENFKATQVILAPEGLALLELENGKAVEYDFSKINTVEIRVGEVDQFYKIEDGNWVQTAISGCGQI